MPPAKTFDPPREFGKTRYIARDGNEWVVGAQRLDILLLRLRGSKYDSVYERVGNRMVNVPLGNLDPVARRLRSEGWTEVV